MLLCLLVPLRSIRAQDTLYAYAAPNGALYVWRAPADTAFVTAVPERSGRWRLHPPSARTEGTWQRALGALSPGAAPFDRWDAAMNLIARGEGSPWLQTRPPDASVVLERLAPDTTALRVYGLNDRVERHTFNRLPSGRWVKTTTVGLQDLLGMELGDPDLADLLGASEPLDRGSAWAQTWHSWISTLAAHTGGLEQPFMYTDRSGRWRWLLISVPPAPPTVPGGQPTTSRLSIDVGVLAGAFVLLGGISFLAVLLFRRGLPKPLRRVTGSPRKGPAGASAQRQDESEVTSPSSMEAPPRSAPARDDSQRALAGAALSHLHELRRRVESNEFAGPAAELWLRLSPSAPPTPDGAEEAGALKRIEARLAELSGSMGEMVSNYEAVRKVLDEKESRTKIDGYIHSLEIDNRNISQKYDDLQRRYDSLKIDHDRSAEESREWKARSEKVEGAKARLQAECDLLRQQPDQLREDLRRHETVRHAVQEAVRLSAYLDRGLRSFFEDSNGSTQRLGVAAAAFLAYYSFVQGIRGVLDGDAVRHEAMRASLRHLVNSLPPHRALEEVLGELEAAGIGGDHAQAFERRQGISREAHPAARFFQSLVKDVRNARVDLPAVYFDVDKGGALHKAG